MSVFKYFTWTTRLDKILEEVEPGDLVRFHRGLFIHHAVYVGRGRAVHHHVGPVDGEVIEVTMEYLAKGDLMEVVKVTDANFPRAELVRRARSRIGPLPYSLHDGNCEHFTTWVYYGVMESKQLSGLCQYELRLLRFVNHSGSGRGNRERSAEDRLNKDLQTLDGASRQIGKYCQCMEVDCKCGQTDVENNNDKNQVNQDLIGHQESDSVENDQERNKDSQEPNDGSIDETADRLNSRDRDQTLAEAASQSYKDQQQGNKDSPLSSSDSFVFVPPRPVKYRHTKNPGRIACNHALSCLKVLTVQSVIGLAAVPLYRCSLLADSLRSLGRQMKPKAADSGRTVYRN